MGLTVADVVERGREEIFEAGGVARPAWDRLAAAVTTTTQNTITLAGRQTNVPPDGVVEFEDSSMEIADVYSVSGATITLQERGFLGSTPATHLINTRVWLDNPYPRYLLVNALKSVITQLRGFGLFREAYTAALTYASTAPVQLPSGAINVVNVLVQNGTNWFPLVKGQHYRVFFNYTGLGSAPALQFFGGGTQGATLRITYKADFDTTTFTLATDLDTVGVPTSLQPHLAIGLAGWVLQGRDVPSLEAEHIRPDPQNPQQIGSRFTIGQTLWRAFREGPVTAERQTVLERFPTVTV